MIFETSEMHATVREGYQILLRADAVLQLPTEGERMREFYIRMANTCMHWAVEVYGDSLRREFSDLDGVRERSSYRTQHYRFAMRFPWSEECYLAVLCESYLSGQWHEPQKSYHRIAHVWNTDEQSILPPEQVLRLFGFAAGHRVRPFRPDGVYPEGEKMVFFRNATTEAPFLEKKLPRTVNKEKI